MIERTIKIRRRYIRKPDYGYLAARVIDTQELVEVTSLCGIVVRRRVIDTEVIPDYVAIELGCLGSTDWKSKWADTHPEAYAN